MATFYVTGSSVQEGTVYYDPNYLTWTLSLASAASSDVTVGYRFLYGSGTVGNDGLSDAYANSIGGTVTFASGEFSKTVSLRVDADGQAEGDESIIMEAFGVDNASVSGGQPYVRSVGWILDDDGAATDLALYVGEPVIVEKDNGKQTADFEVTLSRPAPSNLSISYQTSDGSAVGGEDYVKTSGTLNFLAGQQTASVSVEIIGDTKIEPTESFFLGVTTPAGIGTVSGGTGTILDDDAGGSTLPTLSVTGMAVDEASVYYDPNYLRWTFTLSEAATTQVTADYRILSGTGAFGTSSSGNDAYANYSSGQVIFAPGEISKAISVRVNAESLDEVDETIVVETYAVNGAEMAGKASSLRTAGWILDDDGASNDLAAYTTDVQTVEGDTGSGEVTFNISLSRPAPQTFTMSYATIDGSAKAGQDYGARSGTLTFLKGQTESAVKVPIFYNNTEEGLETFSLVTSAQAGIPITMGPAGKATIFDDDIGVLPVARNDSYTVFKGSQINVVATSGVLKNDTDADGDTLVTQLVQNVKNGTLILNADGSFTYVPKAGFIGTDSFTYYANDKSLSDGSGNLSTNPATVTLNVTGRPPIARNDSYTLKQGSSGYFASGSTGVLANDNDPDGDKVYAKLAQTVKNGSLTLWENGAFKYIPKAGFSGTDSFTYYANDKTVANGTGKLSTTPATVTLTVQPVDNSHAPVARNETYKLIQGSTGFVVSSGKGVLANDSDADGDKLHTKLAQGVKNGTLTLWDDGSFKYVPKDGFFGTDSFTYYANDKTAANGSGKLSATPATVTLTVDQKPITQTTKGDDNLTGTWGKDVADGKNGDDRFDTLGGDDKVNGGNGDDTVWAGSGNDAIFGDAGNDTLYGEAGRDAIFGGGGNDKLYGGSDSDKLIGGADRDKIFGDAGNDKIKGGTGNDKAYGGTGNDKVSGDDGRDKIFGGKGNDKLNGGEDNDKMKGDAGRDKFFFTEDSGKDKVLDFQDNIDTLVLDKSLWDGSLSKGQMLKQYADVVKGNVVFDFGSDKLILLGVDDVSSLSNDLAFI